MASRNAAAPITTTKKSVTSVPGPSKGIQHTASNSKKVVLRKKSGPSKNVTPGHSLTSKTGSTNRSQNIKELGQGQSVPQPGPKANPQPHPQTKTPDRSRVASKVKVDPAQKKNFQTTSSILSEMLKLDPSLKIKANDKPWRHGMKKPKVTGNSLRKETSVKETNKATSKQAVPSHKNEQPVEIVFPLGAETDGIVFNVSFDIRMTGQRQASEVNTEQAPSGMEFKLHEAGFRENDEAKTPNKFTSPVKIDNESSLHESPPASSRELSGIPSYDSVAAMKWVAKPPPTSITHPAVQNIIQGKDISVVFKQLVLDSEVEFGSDRLKSQRVLRLTASGNRVNLERRKSDIATSPNSNLQTFCSEGELSFVAPNKSSHEHAEGISKMATRFWNWMKRKRGKKHTVIAST